MMKPLLFNTEMVRAILDGRKMVTRRLIKPRYRDDECGFQVITNLHTGEFVRVEKVSDQGAGIFPDGSERYVNPPYHIGDILYVRETWGRTAEFPGISEGGVIYAADYSDMELRYYKDKHFRWRPSIHMPKEYARLFLRVTDVRAERLQEITEEGAIAEGCYPGPWLDGAEPLPTARTQFISLWDSTVPRAERDAYGWDANPWVWVIQYEQCEKPKEV